MVSTYTTNKSLEKPGNGDYVDTWNVPVNSDMDAIDQAFGGTTNLNATGGNATLSAAQYRSLIINITGAIGSNVTYTIPSGVGGSWIVSNTATGANVYFVSAAGGSSVLVTTGTVTAIYCDGTSNGMKAAGVSPNGSNASGTWNINITGNAATATTASNVSGGSISATTGSFSGAVTAASFSGAGTNLSGTAASLNIGGNAATATTASSASGALAASVCAAWVNFDGSGNIRGSYNVTSVTALYTGLYRINFTNALPNTNYAAFADAGTGTGTPGNACALYNSKTTTSVIIQTYNVTGSAATTYDQNSFVAFAI